MQTALEELIQKHGARDVLDALASALAVTDEPALSCEIERVLENAFSEQPERVWVVSWETDQTAADPKAAAAMALARMGEPIDLNDPFSPSVFTVRERLQNGGEGDAVVIDLAYSY